MSAQGPDNSDIKQAEPADPPAYGAVSAWLFFLLPAVLGTAADLWAKAVTFPDGVTRDALGRLVHEQGRYARTVEVLIPGVLLQTTANEGAVFGLGQGKRVLFLVFSILALGMVGWVFATSRKRQHWLHLALGLITAGAIGNFYDRLVYSAVRDFLKFTVVWYPYIFNIADTLLCIGVPLLMICWIFDGRSKKVVAGK